MEIWDGSMTTEAPELRDARIRNELTEEGVDLPELADTMEEADARAAADTYLRALGSITREQLANAAEHRTLIAYYQRKQDGRDKQLDGRIEYLSGVIKGLFGFMHTGKKKSLNLLGGRIGMRAQTDELVVEDDEVVIQWADDHGVGALVRVKKSLDRTGLRRHLQEQTDPPPGVKLQQRPDQFYATPAE